jgi:hypothetical protein
MPPLILGQLPLVILNLFQDNRHRYFAILKQVQDDDFTMTVVIKGTGHAGGHSDGGCRKSKLKLMACPMARA